MRAAVVALRAFNVETAQIAEQVRQTGLVPIRFQWWRDAVNSCYRGAPVNHPVVQALAQACMLQKTTTDTYHACGDGGHCDVQEAAQR